MLGCWWTWLVWGMVMVRPGQMWSTMWRCVTWCKFHPWAGEMGLVRRGVHLSCYDGPADDRIILECSIVISILWWICLLGHFNTLSPLELGRLPHQSFTIWFQIIHTNPSALLRCRPYFKDWVSMMSKLRHPRWHCPSSSLATVRNGTFDMRMWTWSQAILYRKLLTGACKVFLYFLIFHFFVP